MYIVRQEVLGYLAELESRAGRWERAMRFADESHGHHPGNRADRDIQIMQPSSIKRWPGRRSDGSTRRESRRRPGCGSPRRTTTGSARRGIAPFSDSSTSRSADLEGARRHLEPAVAWLDRMHAAEPGIIPCVPDLVEALIGLGQIGEAERHLRRLEEQAEALDRVWARATRAALSSAHRRGRRRSRRRPASRRGIGRTPRGLRPAVRDGAIPAGPRPDPSPGEAKASGEGVPRPGRDCLP